MFLFAIFFSDFLKKISVFKPFDLKKRNSKNNNNSNSNNNNNKGRRRRRKKERRKVFSSRDFDPGADIIPCAVSCFLFYFFIHSSSSSSSFFFLNQQQQQQANNKSTSEKESQPSEKNEATNQRPASRLDEMDYCKMGRCWVYKSCIRKICIEMTSGPISRTSAVCSEPRPSFASAYSSLKVSILSFLVRLSFSLSLKRSPFFLFSLL